MQFLPSLYKLTKKYNSFFTSVLQKVFQSVFLRNIVESLEKKSILCRYKLLLTHAQGTVQIL